MAKKAEFTPLQSLYLKKSRFTTGTFARDKDGRHCTYDSETACCWCILGAIQKVYRQGMWPEVIAKLATVAREKFPTLPGVSTDSRTYLMRFNDLYGWKAVAKLATYAKL